MMKILSIFGTRPEAIKMAPLVHKLAESPHIQSQVCVTGQHREMLDQMLSVFNITPDFDMDVMQAGQSVARLASRILHGICDVLEKDSPDLILVHGDTTTAFMAALAAVYHKVPIGHIEAGLRSENLYSPWPEEANRKLIGCLTQFHFAPTALSAENLRKENVNSDTIYITGNTVIDALQMMVDRIESDADLRQSLDKTFNYLHADKKLILVTGHRRESFDGGLERVFKALKQIAARGDVEILYPVHLNPKVKMAADKILKDVKSVYLIDPVDYVPCVYLMRRAHIVVTDSGGIQEEAPSLGKPVLVTRDVTERIEGITAGIAKLVGTDEQKIIEAVNELLDDADYYQKMSKAHNPYGDGNAAERIVKIIEESELCKSKKSVSLV